ncbi:class I SAM-dependent methyltransferase [Desulfoplanes sp.]
MTIYETDPETYFRATRNIDPSSFLAPLEERLPPVSRILDIGCGSGRDLKWLSERGHQPVGIERSQGLARLARNHSGCPVIRADFSDFDFSRIRAQGVVLVGALVHVEPETLPGILARIFTSLLPGGHGLLTLKQGHGTRTHSDGRTFVLWQDDDLRKIFRDLGLIVVDARTQVSRLRPEDLWLGYVLQKDSYPLTTGDS